MWKIMVVCLRLDQPQPSVYKITRFIQVAFQVKDVQLSHLVAEYSLV